MARQLETILRKNDNDIAIIEQVELTCNCRVKEDNISVWKDKCLEQVVNKD